MRLFLDSEFTGLVQDCDLISLALVPEVGEDFYTVFNDYDILKPCSWVRDNVINPLDLLPPDAYTIKTCYQKLMDED